MCARTMRTHRRYTSRRETLVALMQLGGMEDGIPIWAAYAWNRGNRTLQTMPESDPIPQPVANVSSNLEGNTNNEEIENATKLPETNVEALEVENEESEPPKEYQINCPICMAPFVEETTTRCGHIFCRNCIKTELSVSRKCPTCGKKATPRGLIRVFLPSTK